MELQAFAVYDSAAAMYLEPFFAPTVEFAIRGFKEAVNKQGHQFSKFPEDYTLFHLGAYDQSCGEFLSHPPTSLGVALTFVDKAQLSFVEEEEVNDGA